MSVSGILGKEISAQEQALLDLIRKERAKLNGDQLSTVVVLMTKKYLSVRVASKMVVIGEQGRLKR